jgi:hypothetical protein
VRLVASVLVLLGLTACSGKGAPVTPTPAASASGQSLLMVAALPAGGVDLYRAGSDHHARKVGALQAPAFAPFALSVTISAAVDPLVCVLWAERRDGPQLPQGSCYRPQQTAEPRTWGGTPINGLPDDVTAIALTGDARWLAWLDPQPGNASQVDLVSGPLSGAGAVTEAARVPPGRGSTRAREVLWAGTSTLVVTAENPDGSADEHLTTPQAREGWRTGRSKNLGFVDPDLSWEDQITVSATDRTALLLELNPFAANGAPRSRLVSVDRKASRILQVVHTPEPGRQVTVASGGARGVVFDTDLDTEEIEVRTFLRLPGEQAATPLEGLPKNALITAQP